MKIHLGCGQRRLEGYTHVDSREEVKPDHVAEAWNLPFPAGAAELVYASHVLEHVRRPYVQLVLEEWHRVLHKPKGLLRISVPNFSVIAELYTTGAHLERLWGLLHGRQDYEENVHFCSYDYETLGKMLSDAGFFDICTWDPVQVLPNSYDDYSKARLDGVSVSLCMEATAK